MLSKIAGNVYELLTICSCGSNLKCIFNCPYQDCPFHYSQPIFCEDCLAEKKHNHMGVKIDKEVVVL